MAYCGETYDSENYYNEYNNINLGDTKKEPLYVLLVTFFKSLGIQYDLYHMLLSVIIVSLICWSTFKMSKYHNLALGLFLIYPFALYVVQIRNCMAFALSMVAIVFLNNDNNDKDKNSTNWIKKNKNYFLYVILIICASLIHSIYIIFLIFIIAKRFKLKTVILITMITIVIETVVLNKTVLLNIADLFGVKERLEYTLYDQAINGQSDVSFRIIITFILCLLCFCYLLNRKKNVNITFDCTDLMVYNHNYFALKINILCLVIIPVVSLAREIFRIQEALMLFNYITITNNLVVPKNKGKVNIRNLIIISFLFVLIFIDSFLYILRFEGLRQYVLHAVFG